MLKKAVFINQLRRVIVPWFKSLVPSYRMYCDPSIWRSGPLNQKQFSRIQNTKQKTSEKQVFKWSARRFDRNLGCLLKYSSKCFPKVSEVLDCSKLFKKVVLELLYQNNQNKTSQQVSAFMFWLSRVTGESEPGKLLKTERRSPEKSFTLGGVLFV